MPFVLEKRPWGGWPNCFSLSNGLIDLILTSDIGPRLMRCGFLDGPNLLKEMEDQMGGMAEPVFRVRGGHRVWVAPEDRVRTYYPDNVPVEIHTAEGEIQATAPLETSNGIRKQMIVRLSPSEPRLKVIHRIQNCLPWTIELSHWSLTMMAPGGVAISGFPPRGTHPEHLLPTHPLVMWAFSDLSDPRWTFTKKYMVLRQDPTAASPTKLGHFNPKTWGAYLLGDNLFLKQSTADPALRYPDLGCSFETFTNAKTLELETLGPLTFLEPGSWMEHHEDWSLHRPIHIPSFTDDTLDAALLPLLA